MIDTEKIRSMIDVMTRISAEAHEAAQTAPLALFALPDDEEGTEKYERLSDAADDCYEGAVACLDSLCRVLKICEEAPAHV